MALSPGSSTPQHQGLPYPPGQSKLELTPTEVLDQIFGYLSQTPLLSLHDLQDDGLLEADRSAHSNMRSLCLTSKRVDFVARPLLFRTITISSSAMLVRLYEALRSDTRLGCHIREISFEILRKEMGDLDFLPLRSLQSQSLLMGWDEEAGEPDRAVFDNHCCDQILSSCYFEILRRTPKVHRLVIRIQPIYGLSTPKLEDDLDGRIAMYMYQPFFRKAKQALQEFLPGHGSNFLPQLTTLELLGDPNNWRNLFDMTTCEPLLRIPTLTKIATFRDNGHWSALSTATSGPAKSGGALKNVRAAALQQSAFLSHDFRALGILLPALELLKISSLRGVWPVSYSTQARRDRERDLGKDNTYLHEALTQMKNLHTLFLDIESDGFGHGFGGSQVPRTMNPILASLPKLETIRIPLQMLVEDRHEVGSNRIERLANILPVSLKSLTIKVDIRCQRFLFDVDDDSPGLFSCPWPPSTTILDFMEALTLLGHDAFPGLREVVCCYNTKVHRVLSPNEEGETFAGDFEADDLFDAEFDSYQRLGHIRVSLWQQNIALKVAYESRQCHEC